MKNDLGSAGRDPMTTDHALGALFTRKLPDDMVVFGDGWLSESGVQRQLPKGSASSRTTDPISAEAGEVIPLARRRLRYRFLDRHSS